MTWDLWLLFAMFYLSIGAGVTLTIKDAEKKAGKSVFVNNLIVFLWPSTLGVILGSKFLNSANEASKTIKTVLKSEEID